MKRRAGFLGAVVALAGLSLTGAGAVAGGSAPAVPNPASVSVGDPVAGPVGTPLPGLGLVDGLVVDQSGASVADCSILHEPLSPVERVEDIARLSGADGVFGDSVAPGLWEFRAYCPDGGAGTSGAVTVVDESTVQARVVVAGGSTAQDPPYEPAQGGGTEPPYAPEPVALDDDVLPEPPNPVSVSVDDPVTGSAGVPPPGLGLVDGLVVDQSGTPVADCHVLHEPLSSVGPVQDIALVSDANGVFGDSVAPGVWQFRAYCLDGATGTSEAVTVPDQGRVEVRVVVTGGHPAQEPTYVEEPGAGTDTGSGGGADARRGAGVRPPASVTVVTDGAGVSGTADVGAQTLVRSAKASAGLTTTLKGRLLTVAVKAKGAEAPRGKKLVTVSVGKKVLMADLKAHGKAKVKLPKVEKGTKIKIKFVGTSAVASATKVIKAK